MGFELTGFSLSGLGLSWDNKTSAKQIAQDVLDVLADRRVINPGPRNRPEADARFCMDSAQECRALLTEAIKTAKVGSDLREHLRNLRTPFTDFIEAGGPDGANFEHDGGDFTRSQEALREAVVEQAALLATIRGVTCPPPLQG